MNQPKDNTLYDHLVKYHADPLIPVKFQFFKDVVDILSPYPQRFQTDAPMMPFVFGALEEVAEANTAYELVCIDLNDKENQLPCELNKLPTATKSLLSSTVASDTSKLRFKADCGSMIKSRILKINSHDITFKNIDEFVSYDPSKCRLDYFYWKYQDKNKKNNYLWKITIKVFTMSLGQAHIERGFSVNKEIVAENLRSKCLCAQRLVYDAINPSGKCVHEIGLPNKLVTSCITS